MLRTGASAWRAGRGWLVIGILALPLAATALAADGLAADDLAADNLAGGVKQLLATGSKPSAKALEAARAQYAELGKLPGFDTRGRNMPLPWC